VYAFPARTQAFLRDLAHNDREWFAAHRADYEAAYLDPARAFVEAVAPELARGRRRRRGVGAPDAPRRRVRRPPRWPRAPSGSCPRAWTWTRLAPLHRRLVEHIR
jgi:uncharacterized protein (DUF2461 family)